MTPSVFNARLAQANIITKTDFDAKLSGINKKITSNKTKHLLAENELKKLEKFDAAHFRGKNYFEEDGIQNYLVFQPVCKYFEKTGDKVSSWKSKGLSDEKIILTVMSTDKSATKTIYDNARIKVRFNRDLLRQNQVTYNHGPVVNISIVYETTPHTKTSNITLENHLFGAIKLTKNSDIDKYKYSGSGIGFDSRGSFSHPSGGSGTNVIIFGADLSSSVHANNKVKNVLVLGKAVVQGINGTTIYAEKICSTNFTVNNKKFCLSLHYNGDNSYLLVNGKEIHKFKAEDSEIVPYPLCLGGLSEDFEVGYMRASRLVGYVCDFSVDYGAIAVDDILDIHKYLMKKNGIV